MHRLCPMMIAALLVGAAVSNALAQPAPTGIVSSPCPPPDPAAEARLKPIDDLFMTPAASPEAFWAAFTETPSHRAGGGRGTQPRAAGRRLAKPVSLQGGERDARARTAAARRVHGRLDYRQLGPRRSRRCSPTASSVVALAARHRRKCWRGSGRTSLRCDRASCTSWLARTTSPVIPVRRRSRTTSTTSWR